LIYGLDNQWQTIYLRPQMYLNGDAINDGDAVKDTEGNKYSITYQIQRIGVKAEIHKKTTADGTEVLTNYYDVTGAEENGPQSAQKG
jgi:hypothetical protein